MRNRHIPRVCAHCQAPLASSARSCWHCGVEWATEKQPPTTLRLVPTGPPADDALAPGAAAPRVAAAGLRG